MKLLIDAHLPPSLAELLRSRGHDVLHTRDLPHGNRTTDVEINQISMADARIVVTKDADFVNSLIIQGIPYKLLLVSTGNIPNRELFVLFSRNLQQLDEAFASHTYVEFERDRITVHR